MDLSFLCVLTVRYGTVIVIVLYNTVKDNKDVLNVIIFAGMETWLVS